jgi:hypothetical protein
VVIAAYDEAMEAYNGPLKFRHQFTKIQVRITTAVCLYPSVLADTVPVITKAIWDTGAQKSITTTYIAGALNLKPVDQVIIGGVHGKNQADIVVITLEIGQNLHKDMEVAVCPVQYRSKL